MNTSPHIVYTARNYMDADDDEKKRWHEMGAVSGIYVSISAAILTLMLIWQAVGDANGPSWAASYSIIVVMLLVSCASWWHGAKQAKQRRHDKMESRAMHEQIIDL